jgi:ABC-type multidrug transport system ATPase subunit
MVSDEKRTFLFSTDDWVFARKFATRWIVLENQKVVFDGTPSEFLKKTSSFTKEIKDLKDYCTNLASLIQEIA